MVATHPIKIKVNAKSFFIQTPTDLILPILSPVQYWESRGITPPSLRRLDEQSYKNRTTN
jgi:hypothetical protein